MVENELRLAKSRGVPLVAIPTSDPFYVDQLIVEAFKNGGDSRKEIAIIGHDIVRGFRTMNAKGKALCDRVFAEPLGSQRDGVDNAVCTNFVAAMETAIAKFPENTIVIAHGSHRYTEPGPIQVIENARDLFASSGRMLVMLGPSFQFPPELQADVLVIDDPLPDDTQRKTITEKVYTDAELKPDPVALTEAVRYTKGLSPFAVEQTVALSLQKTGLDTAIIRKRWKQTINATPGLMIDESGATFNDIGGLTNFKEFCMRIVQGQAKPSAVIRIEEIEKALAGSSGAVGDTSGVSQGILGALLTFMQEQSATGIVALGPPGSGKSLSSVALGGAAGIPTITFDLGSLKGSLVGQTEQRTRQALRIIQEMAGQNTFWIASCNSIAALPPELRRRFALGTWFFDLPDAEERKVIWKMYIEKFKLPASALPSSEGWTGAEIKTCCEVAWRLKVGLTEAAQYIVPISKSASELIDTLRKYADNRYLSASNPGVYQYRKLADIGVPTNMKKARAFDLTEKGGNN
jgi:hypothetical protein